MNESDFRLNGVHHVSALSAHIDRTHDFYPRVLGLRPIIKTVNQDEPSMYHLFYGDGAGSPGSDLTVFDLPYASPERHGNNSISRTTFRIHGKAAFDYWVARLSELGVEHYGASSRDGRNVLDFEDPEGTVLSLVEDEGVGEAHPWRESSVPASFQIRGLGNIEITVPELEPTHRFLTEALGLATDHAYPGEAPGSLVHVYSMAEGVQGQVHVMVREDLPRARYGAGGVHHVALRVPVEGSMDQWITRLDGLGYRNSGLVDRHYFHSAYVREPNGILFELATDGPGFDVDGPTDADRLSLPPSLEPRRREIEEQLRPLTGVPA